LGGISGMLYISSHGVAGDYPESVDSNHLFAEQSKGDVEVFSRELLGATVNFASEAERFDLFYKTEIRARHTNQFIFVFERLLKHVRSSDTDNMLFDSLIGSAHGLLYLRMKTYQANAPSQWNDHSKTAQLVEL
jgi:hypothetical protein